jgi:hypothetical protein
MRHPSVQTPGPSRGRLQKILSLTLVTLTVTLKKCQGHGSPVGPSVMSVSCTVTEIHRFEVLDCLCPLKHIGQLNGSVFAFLLIIVHSPSLSPTTDVEIIKCSTWPFQQIKFRSDRKRGYGENCKNVVLARWHQRLIKH